MSESDPNEHPKTYEKFCEPRFSRIEKALGETHEGVHNIDVVINDGLVKAVEKLERGQQWLVRLLVGILVTVALASAGMYWQMNRKIEAYALRSGGATEATSHDYREIPDAE